MDHILVCLDLSEMDEALIRYADFLVREIRPASVTFLHVIKSYDIPKEIIADYPHLDLPLTEVVKEELLEKTGTLFSQKSETDTRVIVKEGLTTDTIVRFTRENNVTFTLMGKKVGYEGKGSIVRKVIGIIPSSVLIISETTQHRIKHLLVRMDFTGMSAMAMKMALSLQKKTGAEISCHHVYKLPLNYFQQGSPEKDTRLLQHVEKHSLKEYKKFLKHYDLESGDISCTSSVDPENDEANILYREALNAGVDMVLIGSRVKSELASIIIDSTSEKLAEDEKNIPVFLVTDRKQSMGFMKALFK